MSALGIRDASGHGMAGRRARRLQWRRFDRPSVVLLLLFVVLSLTALAPGRAGAVPEVDLHDLTWFVHVDLIDAGAGRDLAYWQAVIDDEVARGSDLLEGRNGPFDQPCCTRLTRSVAVQTFGSPGDGLDVIDTLAEQQAIAGTGLPGSRAFLVDSLTYCNGSSPSAIGCALRPGCSGIANDDPDLWMYVSVEAFDDGTLASVIAHERGHNACLQHIGDAKCQLMQATVFTPGLGGCLAASECTSLRNARTEVSSGLACSCLDDSGGLAANGAVCDASGGICSGGLCGLITGDAGVELVVAADVGDAGLAPEDALRMSTLSGDWTALGPFSVGADDVRALAWSHDAEILYGVVPSVFEDRVVTIDPATGAILAVMGLIANGADEITGMAYDPGDTPATSDDRLIVLEVDTGGSGEFRAIDPASPSAATLLGSLPFLSAQLFTGLAYDSLQDRLYLATPFGPHGLFRTDLSTCSGFGPCSTEQVAGSGYFRNDASLAYARETGMLYLVGTSFSSPNTRTFFDIIDPATGTSVQTLSLDRFTPAGLAAVPEPGFVTCVTAGGLALLLTARRRGRARR